MINQLVRYQIGASDSTSKVAIKNLDADFVLIPTFRIVWEFSRIRGVNCENWTGCHLWNTQCLSTKFCRTDRQEVQTCTLGCDSRSSHVTSLELFHVFLPTAAILATSLSSVPTVRGLRAFTFASAVRFSSHRVSSAFLKHISVWILCCVMLVK